MNRYPIMAPVACQSANAEEIKTPTDYPDIGLQPIVIAPVTVDEDGPMAQLYQIEEMIRSLEHWKKVFTEWRADALDEILNENLEKEGRYVLAKQEGKGRIRYSVVIVEQLSVEAKA
jgi:hypothetical protein